MLCSIKVQPLYFISKYYFLFQLHICTFGARLYAHTIAGFLDPDKKYFSYRILSRDECFDARSKTANMSALFPCGDSMVCIIDDRLVGNISLTCIKYFSHLNLIFLSVASNILH